MGGLPKVNFGTIKGAQQTNAILRALGAQHGFYDPSDWITASFVDMLCETYSDFFNVAMKAILFTPDEEKPAALEGVRDGILKKLLTICEKNLENNSTQRYIAADHLTIADFCLSALIFNFLKNDMSPAQSCFAPLLDEFPRF